MRAGRSATGTCATATLNSSGPAEDRVQRDESAVTPADDSEPVEIGVRNEILEIRARFDHVLDFLAAVVDRVVESLPVPGASAILRRDDDVPFLHQRADVPHVQVVEVSVNSAVHEDQRRMLARRVLRRKEIGGDGQLAGAAVHDLSHDHLGAELRHEREIGEALEDLLKIELIDWPIFNGRGGGRQLRAAGRGSDSLRQGRGGRCSGGRLSGRARRQKCDPAQQKEPV